MSRRRQHRDVAAAFLLDMSASTDAEAPLDEPDPEPGREPEPEYVGVFDDFDWPDNPQPLPAGPPGDRHREGIPGADGRRPGDAGRRLRDLRFSPASAARRSSSSSPRSSTTTSTGRPKTASRRWNRSAAPGWARRSGHAAAKLAEREGEGQGAAHPLRRLPPGLRLRQRPCLPRLRHPRHDGRAPRNGARRDRGPSASPSTPPATTTCARCAPNAATSSSTRSPPCRASCRRCTAG